MRFKKLFIILLITFLVLSIIPFSFIPKVVAVLTGYIGVNTVNVDATSYPFQRSLFYANGYYWQFFSDGGEVNYVTAVVPEDSENWTIKTAIIDSVGVISGKQFSVWLEDNYFYLTYTQQAYVGEDCNLMFLRGEISGASINWGIEYEIYAGVDGYYIHSPVVSCDTNGIPFVIFPRNKFSASENSWAIVLMGSNADGSDSWTTTTMYISGADRQYCYGSIEQLSDGKMYASWLEFDHWLINGGPASYDYWRGHGKLWSGSSWGDEEQITQTHIMLSKFSTTVTGDNIHFVYYNYGDIRMEYKMRTYGVGWQDEATILGTNADNDYMDDTFTHVTITANTATDSIIVIWNGGDRDVFYYRRYLTSIDFWEDTTLYGTNIDNYIASGQINLFHHSYEGEFGFSWTEDVGSNGYVYFNQLLEFAGTPPPPKPFDWNWLKWLLALIVLIIIVSFALYVKYGDNYYGF